MALSRARSRALSSCTLYGMLTQSVAPASSAPTRTLGSALGVRYVTVACGQRSVSAVQSARADRSASVSTRTIASGGLQVATNRASASSPALSTVYPDSRSSRPSLKVTVPALPMMRIRSVVTLTSSISVARRRRYAKPKSYTASVVDRAFDTYQMTGQAIACSSAEPVCASPWCAQAPASRCRIKQHLFSRPYPRPPLSRQGITILGCQANTGGDPGMGGAENRSRGITVPEHLQYVGAVHEIGCECPTKREERWGYAGDARRWPALRSRIASCRVGSARTNLNSRVGRLSVQRPTRVWTCSRGSTSAIAGDHYDDLDEVPRPAHLRRNQTNGPKALFAGHAAGADLPQAAAHDVSRSGGLP